MEIERIARIAHQINAAYCEAMGDHSQVPWDQAPAWQRESAMNGVLFHIDNPGAGPSGSHENWMKEKEADGWSYGAEKNEHFKVHPCFMPFSRLPKEQQAKDHLFCCIVHELTQYEKDVEASKGRAEKSSQQHDPDSIEWQTYIGAKIIKARPKARMRTDDYDPEMGHSEPGYELMYPDGYRSWSPKAVFEEAYRPLNKDELLFAGQSPAESAIMEITDCSTKEPPY